MSTRKLVALALLLGLAAVIFALTAPSADREEAALRALVPNIVAAWGTMDISKVAPYYAADADFAVHRRGSLAWATFTLAIDLLSKDGSSSHLNARWTMVLEKRTKGWIVVHEHVSVPLGGS